MKMILVLLALPGWLAAQSSGSLFVAEGKLVNFTRDADASQVGDLVTIVVNDSASALASGNSTTSRKTSANSSVSALYGLTNAKLSNLLGTSGDVELAGTGQTARNMTITTTISAHVIGVTPNGYLIVEGNKNIGVNSEKQTITLQGMIRPLDLTTGNTVSSNQVSNLNIQVNGKGVVGDAIRRPHFLARVLLGLLPF